DRAVRRGRLGGCRDGALLGPRVLPSKARPADDDAEDAEVADGQKGADHEVHSSILGSAGRRSSLRDVTEPRWVAASCPKPARPGLPRCRNSIRSDEIEMMLRRTHTKVRGAAAGPGAIADHISRVRAGLSTSRRPSAAASRSPRT